MQVVKQLILILQPPAVSPSSNNSYFATSFGWKVHYFATYSSLISTVVLLRISFLTFLGFFSILFICYIIFLLFWLMVGTNGDILAAAAIFSCLICSLSFLYYMIATLCVPDVVETNKITSPQA